MQPTTDQEDAGTDGTLTWYRSPLRARAWWGDHLVVESDGAVRVEEAGRPPALYFPVADVRFDLFHEEPQPVVCPVKGTARVWSTEVDRGTASTRPESITSWGAEPTRPDGREVLWSFTEPTAAAADLVGLVGVDHDRVRVEVIDGHEGDDPRDVTTKRFPTWGDASHLVELLDVVPAGDGRFVSAARTDWRRPVVEGSQILGQAIVAAMRSSDGRRPVSAHMVFTRAADAAIPIELELDQVAAGRTFTSFSIDAVQVGRRCAVGTVLLDQIAPDLVRHMAPPPDVPGPYDSPPYDMGVTGRDLRIVDGAYTDDPDAPIGPPVIDAWVRFRDLPDDPAVHAGLLAQFTGHLAIAAAMRPHAGIGQRDAHRTLSTAINAIAISFHADVRADRWLLYHHRSTFAGDGMSHASCRVHHEDGTLVASFTVDAMIRGFADPGGAVDDRTAL